MRMLIPNDTCKLLPSFISGTMTYSLTACLAPGSQVSMCRFIHGRFQPTLLASGEAQANEIEPRAILAQAEFAAAFVGDFDVIITAILSCNESTSETMEVVSGEPTILILEALDFLEKVDWCT